MLSSLFRCAGLACAVMVVQTSVCASDTTPPVLTSFDFNPKTIDTANGPATVTIEFTGTDDISGGIGFVTWFVSPSGKVQVGGNGVYCPPPARTCDGSVVLTFPQYVETGVWTIWEIWASDEVGNRGIITAADLAARNWPAQLMVLGNPDTTPPVLEGFFFTPSTIDTTDGPADLTVTFTGRDDLSGGAGFVVWFVSPSGKQQVGGYGVQCPLPALSCTRSVVLTFPQYIETGIWTVSEIRTSDLAANQASLSAADLVEKGLPTQLTVLGIQDISPPVPTALNFTPTAIDTTSSTATLTITFTGTDDVSGVDGCVLWFRSPSGGVQVGGYGASCQPPSKVCTSSVDLTFPQYSEQGIWSVSDTWISDRAGNRGVYTAGDLSAQGLPSRILNTTLTVPELLFIGASATPTSTKGRWTTLKLQALVQNIGNLPASKAQASFAYSTDGGLTYSDLGTAKLGTLAPGATGVAAYTWKAAAGSYMIRVTLDPGNHIVEFDETNNEAIVQVTVP